MDTEAIMNALLASSMTLIIGSVVALLASVFLGAVFLNYGLQAGDGQEDASFGERLGSTIILMLLSAVIPPIGTLIAIKVLGNRHEMNFGKSTLAYLVWNFLTSMIIAVIVVAIIFISLGATLMALIGF
ncbi:hypothetical protein JW979_08260 [bacterium]|nr:hypothetical protein [candidate division CSSED10-310 bacterium]